MLLLVGATSPAMAQLGAGRSQQPGNATSQPVLLTADEVNEDRDLHIVTARGHVEITSGQRILRANVVNYDEGNKVVTASGNVTLMEPTGEVLFADYMELTDTFREGTIQNLRAMLADRSRLAAVSGRRVDGNVTIARRAVYSPCELCRDDPTSPPIWQLKAARIEHNQQEKQVQYRDAWMEIYGVPVAYTPYLQHPDGTQPRSSGILAPGYASSNVTGTRITVPYYQVIDDSSDITFSPIFIPDDNPVAAAEYRAMTQKGYVDLSGSITKPNKHRFFTDTSTGQTDQYGYRGHVKGEGQFDINNDSRWGFNVERASDKFYLDNYSLLSRYRFANYNTLTSRLYAEQFTGTRGTNYASINSYAFQGLLTTDDPAQSPLVLPVIDYNYIGDRDRYGGHYTLDTNFLSIARRSGTEDQRGSMKAGWHLPYIANTGEVYSLDATLQGDLWHASSWDNTTDPFNPTEGGISGRLFPQLALGWRYPLVRRGAQWQTILEPIASVDVAPNVSNQQRFPNEDSRGIDIDETNLFSANRFTGYDRVEGGQRVNYGLNSEFGHYRGGRVQAFVGQSYRLQEESAIPQGTGLDHYRSNYVTKLLVSPHPWMSTVFRGQFGPDFTTERASATASFGPPAAATLSTSYIFIKAATQASLNSDVKQIAPALNLRLTPYWRFSAYDVHDLGVNSGQLLSGIAAVYEDECIILDVDLRRRFIGTVNNPEETLVTVRIVFRNLGEVDTAGPSF